MSQSREIDRNNLPKAVQKCLAKILKPDEMSSARAFKVRDGVFLIRDVKGERVVLLQDVSRGAILVSESMSSKSDNWKEENAPGFFKNLFADAERYLRNEVLKAQWKEVSDVDTLLERITEKNTYDEVDRILEAWFHPTGLILAHLTFFDGDGWHLFRGGKTINAPFRTTGKYWTTDDDFIEYDCPFYNATPKKIVRDKRKDGKTRKTKVKK